jgi:DNA-binding NarL/FixJ family response regulator
VSTDESTDAGTTPKPTPASAASAAAAAPQPAPTGGGAPASGGTRILVAEDETLIRLDLVEMLGEQGYDVVGQASNGEQAVELAKEVKPDLVIMDVKMPVLDGLSAAEQLHEAKLCPVIMLTAFSQTELVERARDAGVMAYIVKPFTADDLRSTSRRRAGRSSRPSRRRSPTSGSASRPASSSTVPRAC